MTNSMQFIDAMKAEFAALRDTMDTFSKGMESNMDALGSKMESSLKDTAYKYDDMQDALDKSVKKIMNRLDDVECVAYDLNPKLDKIDKTVNERNNEKNSVKKPDYMGRIINANQSTSSGTDYNHDILRQRMDAIDVKVNAMIRNMRIRQTNHLMARREDSRVEPLYSVITGEIIPDFPRRLEEMDNLLGSDVDRILRQLGESVLVTMDFQERKLTLSNACGCYLRS